MKITEQSSRFDHLEKMSVSELLQHINEEDCRVARSKFWWKPLNNG